MNTIIRWVGNINEKKDLIIDYKLALSWWENINSYTNYIRYNIFFKLILILLISLTKQNLISS